MHTYIGVAHKLNSMSSQWQKARKTIQNTPSQQHPVFSNTGKLWGGFHFLFLYNFFLQCVFFQLKNSFSFSCQSRSIFFSYVFIYRNVIPRNLNSLLRPDVAVWTFDVWFLIYAFSSITLKILNLQIRRPNICLSYIWSKILSSSLYTMLKLSKTTSPNKLFDYDCVTVFRRRRYH